MQVVPWRVPLIQSCDKRESRVPVLTQVVKSM